MSLAVLAALAALAFALAGYGGTLVADALCAGCVPFEDGPAPVSFRRGWFALAAGCIGCALALQHEPPAQLAFSALLVLALAGCTAADLRCGILPDMLTLPPLALIVGMGYVRHDVGPAVGGAIVFAPFAVAALVTRGRGMGWGDAKLAALGGALLGAADATLAFMFAAVAAYVVARLTGGLRNVIAFGPYLATSIAASLALMRTP
jgi:leader peptidase (prepilin peptidase) / N-methyltransferase